MSMSIGRCTRQIRSSQGWFIERFRDVVDDGRRSLKCSRQLHYRHDVASTKNGPITYEWLAHSLVECMKRDRLTDIQPRLSPKPFIGSRVVQCSGPRLKETWLRKPTPLRGYSVHCGAGIDVRLSKTCSRDRGASRHGGDTRDCADTAVAVRCCSRDDIARCVPFRWCCFTHLSDPRNVCGQLNVGIEEHMVKAG